jgi:pimeloyl-ACP methyl ester carboxylesterase
MVYLHGFGASQGEGAPTHRRLARAFGCNLFLARLPGHGRVADDAMRGLSAQRLVDGAAEALAIGHVLGDKVVVIGTSTGGALALVLAAQRPGAVDALVLWSPLVRERDDRLAPLLWPWGGTALQWLRNHGCPIVRGSAGSPYWSAGNHLDGYRALVSLTRGGLTPSTFARIRAPLFLGYYYRDAQHQDLTVSVPAMLAMYDALGTPPALRRSQAFPDAGAHVIASPLRSQSVEAVYRASRDFLHEVAGLPLSGAQD